MGPQCPQKKETLRPILKIVNGDFASTGKQEKFNNPPYLTVKSSDQLLRWLLMTDAGLSVEEADLVSFENTDLEHGIIYLPQRISYITTERLLRVMVMMVKSVNTLKSANGS